MRNLAGSYTIRINDPWRIVFAFENGRRADRGSGKIARSCVESSDRA